MDKDSCITEISRDWDSNSRWKYIQRPYAAEDVVRLRGSIQVEHTLARLGAERLWHLLNTAPFVQTMAAYTGIQAIHQVRAGLQAINVSGASVANDGNDSNEMYPDEGLYPVSSVPNAVRRINNALRRADQIAHAEGKQDFYWLVPIKADGEAGFGGVLNTFGLTKDLIEAGAAAVSFEDQLPAAKKCGHLGGKVLVPTSEHIRKLVAARLAADVMGVPTILIARTDSKNAALITSDIDPNDQPFLTGKRTVEGHWETRGNLSSAINRGLAYAPYADLLWFETSGPDLEEARQFSQAIHAKFPGKLLYYNCSSSFNWKKTLDPNAIAQFQPELAKLGYKFQNCSRMGLSSMYLSLFNAARSYREEGMPAYAAVQEAQLQATAQAAGYGDWKHHHFVGTGYFDDVARTIVGAELSTAALIGSTEEEQF
jgi:isocitrate lyase